MFLFIFFEGEALHVLVKQIGYKQNRLNTFVYSSADIYFSAVTPSATGGQPASAYYMHEDGIPVSKASAVLSYNIVMYTASLIFMTVVTFLLRFNLFLSLEFWPKLFVVAGVVIQSIIFVGFILLMLNEKAVLAICRFFISVLCKLRIKKNKEAMITKISESVKKFRLTVNIIGKSRRTAVKVFALNLLQRISILGISVFIFFGAGIEGASVIDVFALQALCLIGANSVPIPGAVGVSEWLYLSAFSSLMSSTTLMSAMMATRGVSYYICFILAGVVTLIRHVKLIFYRDKHRYD